MTQPTADRTPVGQRFTAASVLVFLALVVTAVLLGVRNHRHHESVSDASVRERSVLGAARSEAVALTTIGYQSAAADLARVLDGATGPLRAQFEKERAALPSTLQKNQSSSRGTVLSSALASLSGATAKVVVAADATLTGTDVGGSGVVKHYRMVLTMQRQPDGGWLASNVAFAGEPQ